MTDSTNSLRNHPRGGLFAYTLIVLAILLVVAFLFLQNTNWSNPFNATPSSADWLGEFLLSIWFATLGALAINLKGIADHRNESNRSFRKWDLWYLERPVSGIIVGIVTYVLLQAANISSPPYPPTLAVVAFVFGMQEKRFSDFLYKISSVLLSTKDSSSKST